MLSITRIAKESGRAASDQASLNEILRVGGWKGAESRGWSDGRRGRAGQGRGRAGGERGAKGSNKEQKSGERERGV